VRVAQALFQAHHGFAIDGETEMPGFDDAGMHRPNRDFVQALALDGEEVIADGCRCAAPHAVVEPGPRIGDALGAQAGKVAQRTFGAQRWRMQAADGRKGARLGVEAHHRDCGWAGGVGEGHVDAPAIGP